MTDPAPILDYAGPRPRGRRVRLPARSELGWAWDAAGERFQVVETLAGKSEAVAALVFAGFTLVLLGASTLGSLGDDPLRQLAEGALAVMWLPAGVWMAEFAVMLAVVNNTWRKTELWATPDGIGLRFRAPLQPTREHRWPREYVADVLVVRTIVEAGEEPHAELELRLTDPPPAKLFPGHPDVLLAEVALHVRRALRLDPGGDAADGR